MNTVTLPLVEGEASPDRENEGVTDTLTLLLLERVKEEEGVLPLFRDAVGFNPVALNTAVGDTSVLREGDPDTDPDRLSTEVRVSEGRGLREADGEGTSLAELVLLGVIRVVPVGGKGEELALGDSLREMEGKVVREAEALTDLSPVKDRKVLGEATSVAVFLTLPVVRMEGVVVRVPVVVVLEEGVREGTGEAEGLVEEEAGGVPDADSLGLARSEGEELGLAAQVTVQADVFVVDGEPDTLTEGEVRAEALGQEVELLDTREVPVPPITPVADSRGVAVINPVPVEHRVEVEDGEVDPVAVREFPGDRDTDTLTDSLEDAVPSPPEDVTDRDREAVTLGEGVVEGEILAEGESLGLLVGEGEGKGELEVLGERGGDTDTELHGETVVEGWVRVRDTKGEALSMRLTDAEGEMRGEEEADTEALEERHVVTEPMEEEDWEGEGVEEGEFNGTVGEARGLEVGEGVPRDERESDTEEVEDWERRLDFVTLTEPMGVREGGGVLLALGEDLGLGVELTEEVEVGVKAGEAEALEERVITPVPVSPYREVVGRDVEERLASEEEDRLGEVLELPVGLLLLEGFAGLGEDVELGESRGVEEGVEEVDLDREALMVGLEVPTGDLERLGEVEGVRLARADLDTRGDTVDTGDPEAHWVLEGVRLEEEDTEGEGWGDRDADWEGDTVGVTRNVGDAEEEGVMEGEGLEDIEAEADA